MSLSAKDGVSRVHACRLQASTAQWPFAQRETDAIDGHWAKRCAESPSFFNGTVYMMAAGSERLTGGMFACTLFPTGFKNFLYWKEHGYPDADAYDCFGSAILRSVEGHVLLGKQAAGNVNSGLAYLPGGFIDARDVDATGSVDIGASIARELAEETLLASHEIERLPGFRVIRCGAQVSLAVEFRSPLSSDALRTAVLERLRSGGDGELTDLLIVRDQADLSPDYIPVYTRLALSDVFAS